MSRQQPNTEPAQLDAELVAYLDGEVDEAESRRIEAMLAERPEVRQRLGELQQTWEMLEQLGRSETDDRLSQTTMEVVASAAETARHRWPSDRARRWAAAAIAVLGTLLLGFGVGAALAPNPNRQLIRDLPILENLEPYRQVDGIEFLRMLHRDRLFVEQPDAGSDAGVFAAPGFFSNDPDQRRAQLDQLPAEDRSQLRRRWKQFQSLSDGERARLRKLHADIQRAPDGESLLQTVHRYYQWLTVLPSYVRAELRELKPKPRVARIRQMLGEQRRAAAKRLSADDTRGLVQWMEHLAEQRGEALLRHLPEPLQRRLASADEQKRRRATAWLIFMRWQVPGSHWRPDLSKDDLDDLVKRLTPDTARKLESLPLPDRWRLVGVWVRDYFRHRWRGDDPAGLPVDEDELVEFFENELSPEERDRLLSLPGEQMQRELRRAFFASQVKRTDKLRGRPHRGRRFPMAPGGGPPRVRPAPRGFGDPDAKNPAGRRNASGRPAGAVDSDQSPGRAGP
jgi:hypothetical protein